VTAFIAQGVLPTGVASRSSNTSQAFPRLAKIFRFVGKYQRSARASAYMRSAPLGRSTIFSEIKNDPQMQYAFKTPTLRSAPLHPPYMHNASAANLSLAGHRPVWCRSHIPRLPI
jgi:cytochrome c peroxidase